MRQTAHDRNSLGDCIVKWANSDKPDESPIVTFKASRATYEAIRQALKRDGLPVSIKSFRGAGIALGQPALVESYKSADVSARIALEQRVTALKALARVLESWSPYSGLAEVYGAPSSFQPKSHRTDKPWRTEQPHETDLRIYGASLEEVAARYENRVCRFVPTAAEVDAMVIPGV